LVLVDVSHMPQWISGAGGLGELDSDGWNVPRNPGQVEIQKSHLIVRLTPTECRVMALGDERATLTGAGTTDVTDGFATFAVVGPRCMDVLGKLSPVDLDAPGQTCPCAAQAPVEDIPSLIVRLNGTGDIPGLIISVARGYGQSFLDLLLDAGNEYGITVAGWERFQGWLAM